jgi:hypothetical protein
MVPEVYRLLFEPDEATPHLDPLRFEEAPVRLRDARPSCFPWNLPASGRCRGCSTRRKSRAAEAGVDGLNESRARGGGRAT